MAKIVMMLLSRQKLDKKKVSYKFAAINNSVILGGLMKTWGWEIFIVHLASIVPRSKQAIKHSPIAPIRHKTDRCCIRWYLEYASRYYR